VGELQGKLERLPEGSEPQHLTKAQAIRRLLPEILAARAKGYSVPAVAKVLTDGGLPVSPAALQKYLSQAKKMAKGPTVRSRTSSVAAPRITAHAQVVASSPGQGPAQAGRAPAAVAPVGRRPVDSPGSFEIRPDTKPI
jgi:hypothetical protein